MSTHLVWFRKDLRSYDNPALYHASQNAKRLMAVYIETPRQQQQHLQSAAQAAFTRSNVDALASQLNKLGITLHLLHCEDFMALPNLLAEFCRTHEIDHVFANYEIEINERRRDDAVAKALHCQLSMYNGDCVLPHGSVRTQEGTMYRVFTPFAKAWLKQVQVVGYQCLPSPKPCQTAPNTPRYNMHIDTTLHAPWQAGEKAARQQLQRFLQENIDTYDDFRDIPQRNATSALSPYLALGVLSVNACLQALVQHLGKLPTDASQVGFSWLNELIWREFYRHLLYDTPRLCMHQSFKKAYDKIKWRKNTQALQAWQEGMTGYPLIDAAMRCLKRSAWMHNRLRMVVASFLCKDLHLDWREGEAWFMLQLIDGDLAANNGGWQWAASSGADAAPYFRIFNPISQSKRFDPQGEFIRQWVEELREVPTKYIHQPHTWLSQHQPHSAYPPPIVDHAQARQQTLTLYKEALKTAH